jgi:hypothetical protein
MPQEAIRSVLAPCKWPRRATHRAFASESYSSIKCRRPLPYLLSASTITLLRHHTFPKKILGPRLDVFKIRKPICEYAATMFYRCLHSGTWLTDNVLRMNKNTWFWFVCFIPPTVKRVDLFGNVNNRLNRYFYLQQSAQGGDVPTFLEQLTQ